MKWKTKQYDSEEQKMQCRTAYGFLYLNGAATRGIGWEEEISPTIMALGGGIAVVIYGREENDNPDREEVL